MQRRDSHLAAVLGQPLGVRREGDDVSQGVVEIVALEELQDILLVPIMRDAPHITPSSVLCSAVYPNLSWALMSAPAKMAASMGPMPASLMERIALKRSLSGAVFS